MTHDVDLQPTEQQDPVCGNPVKELSCAHQDFLLKWLYGHISLLETGDGGSSSPANSVWWLHEVHMSNCPLCGVHQRQWLPVIGSWCISYCLLDHRTGSSLAVGNRPATKRWALLLRGEQGFGTARVTWNHQKLLNWATQEPKDWGGTLSHSLHDGSAFWSSTGSKSFITIGSGMRCLCSQSEGIWPAETCLV